MKEAPSTGTLATAAFWYLNEGDSELLVGVEEDSPLDRALALARHYHGRVIKEKSVNLADRKAANYYAAYYCYLQKDLCTIDDVAGLLSPPHGPTCLRQDDFWQAYRSLTEKELAQYQAEISAAPSFDAISQAAQVALFYRLVALAPLRDDITDQEKAVLADILSSAETGANSARDLFKTIPESSAEKPITTCRVSWNVPMPKEKEFYTFSDAEKKVVTELLKRIFPVLLLADKTGEYFGCAYAAAEYEKKVAYYAAPSSITYDGKPTWERQETFTYKLDFRLAQAASHYNILVYQQKLFICRDRYISDVRHKVFGYDDEEFLVNHFLSRFAFNPDKAAYYFLLSYAKHGEAYAFNQLLLARLRGELWVAGARGERAPAKEGDSAEAQLLSSRYYFLKLNLLLKALPRVLADLQAQANAGNCPEKMQEAIARLTALDVPGKIKSLQRKAFFKKYGWLVVALILTALLLTIVVILSHGTALGPLGYLLAGGKLALLKAGAVCSKLLDTFKSLAFKWQVVWNILTALGFASSFIVIAGAFQTRLKKLGVYRPRVLVAQRKISYGNNRVLKADDFYASTTEEYRSTVAELLSRLGAKANPLGNLPDGRFVTDLNAEPLPAFAKPSPTVKLVDSTAGSPPPSPTESDKLLNP